MKKTGFVAQPHCQMLIRQYDFGMNKPIFETYRTTNWPAYNQVLINRGNISIQFDLTAQYYAQLKGKQGRNQTYSDIAE